MKKFCERCLVYVDQHHTNCPLCGAYLEKEIQTESTDALPITKKIFYAYPMVNNEYLVRSLVRNISIFLSIIALIATFFVDLLVTPQVDWFYHVAVGITAFWFIIGRVIFFNVEVRRQMFIDCVALVLMMFYIEFTTQTGSTHWAMRWATPGIILMCQFALIILMVCYYKEWGSYAMPLALMCSFCWIPIVVSYCIYDGEIWWTLIVQSLLGGAVLLALAVFGNRRFYEEIKKRFHI